MADKRKRHNAADEMTPEAAEETIRLYTAWLALLLKRLNGTVIRVSREELREALDGLSCAIGLEGDTYVIYPDGKVPESGAKNGEENA